MQICVLPKEHVPRFFRFSKKPMNRKKENPLLCTSLLSLYLPFSLSSLSPFPWKGLDSPRPNMVKLADGLCSGEPSLDSVLCWALQLPGCRLRTGKRHFSGVFLAWPAAWLDNHAASSGSTGAAPLPGFLSSHLVLGR